MKLVQLSLSLTYKYYPRDSTKCLGDKVVVLSEVRFAKLKKINIIIHI